MWVGYLAIIGWGLIIPSLQEGIDLCVTDGNDAIKKIRSTFLTQEIIDAKLHYLAKALDEICNQSVNFQQSDENPEELLEFRRKRIADKRTYFWETVEMAHMLGFKAPAHKTSYKQCLVIPFQYEESKSVTAL